MYPGVTDINKEEILNSYFDKACQVVYWINKDDVPSCGIAYCDEIISADDGCIVALEDVYKLRVLHSWNSLEKAIDGGD